MIRAKSAVVGLMLALFWLTFITPEAGAEWFDSQEQGMIYDVLVSRHDLFNERRFDQLLNLYTGQEQTVMAQRIKNGRDGFIAGNFELGSLKVKTIDVRGDAAKVLFLETVTGIKTDSNRKFKLKRQINMDLIKIGPKWKISRTIQELFQQETRTGEDG